LTKHDRFVRALAISFAVLIPALAFFTHLATLGLIGPDEPRYAWIARAMAETHDWVTPRLYGQPWFEKPALFYWLAGIGFRFLKSAEIAARLPSALAALAATLAIAWIALKQYGERIAWTTLVIFPTTVAAIGFARAATPDMLFTASLACTMACAAGILRRDGLLRGLNGAAAPVSSARKDSARFVLFGASLGAATLAKGPAAIVLAGGSLLLWAAWAGNVKELRRFFHPLAIAAFAIVALPWYVICAARNPGFLREFLFRHNVERFLTPEFQHHQPFWYFGSILLMALLPWTILLVPAGAEGLRLWREKSWRNSPGFFLACWAVFPIVFFSLSQSKLPGYILPAIPQIAVLLAVSTDRWIDRRPWTSRYILIAAGLVLWAILYFFVRDYGQFIPEFFRFDVLVLEFLVFFLVSTGPIATTPRISIGLISMSVIFVLAIGGVALSITNPPLSARPLLPTRGWFMTNRRATIAVYRVHRNWQYGLNFYFGRELPEWTPAFPGGALVFTSPEGAEELSKQTMVTSAIAYGNPPCVKMLIQNTGR
jgi:4-amino-4-deoxy-L-arabinose transferase-like glycosyltransferase